MYLCIVFILVIFITINHINQIRHVQQLDEPLIVTTQNYAVFCYVCIV